MTVVFDPHILCPPTQTPVLGRPDKPPCPNGLLSVPDFIECMAQTLEWTQESLRSIEARAVAYGGLPRSTLYYILKHRKTLPSERQLEAFVFACRLGNHWDSWRATRTVIAYIHPAE